MSVMPSLRPLRAAGLAAGVAAPFVAWSLSLVVIAGWPGYDPVARSISVLATAPLGWLQSTAFALSGVLGIAWALALPSVLGATPRDRSLVRGVLLLVAVITLAFAILPTDPEGVPRTTTGRLHLLDFAAYAIAMPVSLLVVGSVMRRDPRWRGGVRPTFAAAGLAILSLAFIPATIDGALTPWLGLLERLYVAIPSVWQVAVGIAAWRLVTNVDRGVNPGP
jgi:hypothetical protein